MRKIMLLLVAVLALAACGSGGGTHSSSTPTPFDGIWKDNSNFVATIKADSIEIDLIDKQTNDSSLYWQGTFPQDTDTNTIVSKADKKALDASITGSSDTTKTFTFKNGELLFKASFFNMPYTTIHLQKAA